MEYVGKCQPHQWHNLQLESRGLDCNKSLERQDQI